METQEPGRTFLPLPPTSCLFPARRRLPVQKVRTPLCMDLPRSSWAQPGTPLCVIPKLQRCQVGVSPQAPPGWGLHVPWAAQCRALKRPRLIVNFQHRCLFLRKYSDVCVTPSEVRQRRSDGAGILISREAVTQAGDQHPRLSHCSESFPSGAAQSGERPPFRGSSAEPISQPTEALQRAERRCPVAPCVPQTEGLCPEVRTRPRSTAGPSPSLLRGLARALWSHTSKRMRRERLVTGKLRSSVTCQPHWTPGTEEGRESGNQEDRDGASAQKPGRESSPTPTFVCSGFHHAPTWGPLRDSAH